MIVTIFRGDFGMRTWNQLYSSLKKESTSISSSLLSNLQLGIMESYKNGISLKKECMEQEKISRLFITSTSSSLISDEKENFLKKPNIGMEEDLEKNEKVQFYLDLVFSSNIQTKEELYHYLPSSKEEYSFYYLSKILYALAKEKKDYLSILEDFEGEDQKHILNEVESIEHKMSWIHEYMSPDFEIEEIGDSKKNSLVYLETASNKACVLSNLKSNDIPLESYASFMRLFQCLEEGIFPGLRKLQTTAPLFEIKDGTSRVIFTRVYKNYYCILIAYIKKCLWEKELRIQLQNAEDNYSRQSLNIYKFLKENNEEYLFSQKQFKEQIFSLLDRGQNDIGGGVKCKK